MNFLIFISFKNTNVENLMFEFILKKKEAKKNDFQYIKKTHNTYCGFPFAEKEGFEPPDLLQSTVFKTAAFDHSAISPFAIRTAAANIEKVLIF